MTMITAIQAVGGKVAGSVSVFVRDVGHGLFEVCHNSLALVGLVVVAVLVFAGTRADLLPQAEQQALSWLQLRHDTRSIQDGNVLVTLVEPDAVSRATASDPAALPRQQSIMARWIARRYKVAPEPISRLVAEAWAVGQKAGLDPTLILAIMAVESSFNPFAQSAVGAQGLMQVMTSVHDDKYEAFGGIHAAFDPVTNLRVGVQVLKECIARAGDLESGLRHYVGAANMADDGGYAGKVLGEQVLLKQVLSGKSISPSIAATPVMSAPALKAADGAEPSPDPAAKHPDETPPQQLALVR